jgi:large subunit ribosomal protein L21
MVNIAVIKLGGSQHLVKAGDRLEVNRLSYKIGEPVEAEVLLSTNGDQLLINDGKVVFNVVENKKGKKLHVIKFRAKSRYRRKKGHRQLLSVIEVVSVNGETSVKQGSTDNEVQNSHSDSLASVKAKVRATKRAEESTNESE